MKKLFSEKRRNLFHLSIYKGKKRDNFASLTFEEWTNLRSTVYELEIDEDKGLCSCNCYLGVKKNFSKHRIPLILKLDMMIIPEEGMVIP